MPEGLRLAEMLAALSLATDLGMGQPLEQALRTCLIALGLGERLGLRDEQGEVYYVALLRFLGCTADAHEWAEMAGGDDIALRAAIAPVLAGTPGEFASAVMPRVGAGSGPVRRARLVVGMMREGRRRAREGVRAHCELAEGLAGRLGLPGGVRAGLGAAFEQWNGTGFPVGLAGEAIPLSARVVFLARDVEVLHRQGGLERVRRAVRDRRGAAYDPAVAEALLSDAAGILDAAGTASPWDEVLRQEPQPRPWVPEGRLDSVLSVFADFIDLKSPFTAGHSRAVAALAAGAGGDDAAALRRAGLVHDLGRAAVPNGIWDKPGPLTDGEWERVRLHPYYSERIVSRVGGLADLAVPAGMHHERLDGSGYHRGSARGEIGARARILAAADAYQAMTQPRPHRPALAPERAAEELEAMSRSGRLDHEATARVLTAAGHGAPRLRQTWPADLSEREVEVLRLICRGGTKKEVARRLSISPSTVDHHVRHIYEKAGVQTRAGATLFALEHDLLP
jgi:HD-GYP domain-containing protein (c-di-GMP phosphodiesterase class II)/DNA-binding CsgD family transcriptional regulator